MGKYDIENYEDALMALFAATKNLPPNPKWMVDASHLFLDWFPKSKLTDGEKAEQLIRDVFHTQANFARWLGCSVQQVKDLIRGKPGSISDWADQDWDAPSDRFWSAWTCHSMLKVLANPLYLTDARMVHLCEPEEITEFRKTIVGLQTVYEDWHVSNLGQTLSEMICLAENKYESVEPRPERMRKSDLEIRAKLRESRRNRK